MENLVEDPHIKLRCCIILCVRVKRNNSAMLTGQWENIPASTWAHGGEQKIKLPGFESDQLVDCIYPGKHRIDFKVALVWWCPQVLTEANEDLSGRIKTSIEATVVARCHQLLISEILVRESMTCGNSAYFSDMWWSSKWKHKHCLVHNKFNKL